MHPTPQHFPGNSKDPVSRFPNVSLILFYGFQKDSWPSRFLQPAAFFSPRLRFGSPLSTRRGAEFIFRVFFVRWGLSALCPPQVSDVCRCRSVVWSHRRHCRQWPNRSTAKCLDAPAPARPQLCSSSIGRLSVLFLFLVCINDNLQALHNLFAPSPPDFGVMCLLRGQAVRIFVEHEIARR